MDEQHIALGGLFLALLTVAVAVSGFVVATWYKMNPLQKHRDELLTSTLDAAEKRVRQLETDVGLLEKQVTRLREDLAWERDVTRKLRRDITQLRLAAINLVPPILVPEPATE